ncbi:MAG: arsenate reductase family protein [Bacteriovoracia bacterium]
MAEHLHIWALKHEDQMDKLIQVFSDFEVPFTFHDYRDDQPEDDRLMRWAEYLQQDYPVNGRSTLWKKSERMFMRLEPAERMNWLRKHYHVLERPIVEDENFEVLMTGARPERILKELCNIRL